MAGRRVQQETAAQPFPEKVDMVNQPPHYQSEDGLECIDAIRAALGRNGFIAFLRGQIIKYTWRLGKKGDAAEDHAKGMWYGDKLAEVLSEDVI